MQLCRAVLRRCNEVASGRQTCTLCVLAATAAWERIGASRTAWQTLGFRGNLLDAQTRRKVIKQLNPPGKPNLIRRRVSE